MSRRSPGSAAADWVAAIKAARASAVMSVFMVASIRVTDHRPSVRAAAHGPTGRRLRNGGCHRRCHSPVMQVTLGDDSELYVSIQQFQRPSRLWVKRGNARNGQMMLALLPKADIERHDWHVRFVQKRTYAVQQTAPSIWEFIGLIA